jgi:branched-chain amino acid transport system substrate-binding protein
MDELGYKPKNLLAQAAGFADKATFDAVGDKLDGLISRASFSIDMAAKRPSIAAVNDLFKKRAGRDLNDNTSRQLMSVLIIADAIDRAKSTDGEKIRAALAATNTPGDQTIMPWKSVHFGADGQNPDADPVLIQYIGGKFVTIYPESVAIAKAKWPMNA